MATSELKSNKANNNSSGSTSTSNHSSSSSKSSSSKEVNPNSNAHGGYTEKSVPEPHMPIVPTSPSYPPYGATTTAYMDPNQNYDPSADPAVNYTTYVYPLSPQFSVQYYPDYSNGYQSYPVHLLALTFSINKV
ncbi:hypothetical protein G6F42_015146 [Rhizopus arrhizus]|nr:hypothetical protein G6F42_015146 [Rhizopus arrhizus]